MSGNSELIGKELKTITVEDEAAMNADAAEYVGLLVRRYPDARPIDVLNAFLQEFTRRSSE